VRIDVLHAADMNTLSQIATPTKCAAKIEIPVGAYWAKLDEKTGDWHPLIAHSADVATVMWQLLTPGALFERHLAWCIGQKALTLEQRAALCLLAALHDIGKTNHAFQENRSRRRASRYFREGHVRVLLQSLQASRALRRTVARAFRGLNEADDSRLGDLLTTVICHHGRPWKVNPRSELGHLWQKANGREPIREIERIATLAREWTGAEDLSSLSALWASTRATHLFAGLLTLADWIASTREAFEFCPDADADPNAYWQTALRRAEKACEEFGVTPKTRVTNRRGTSLLETLFPEVFPRHSPTKLQQFLSEMLLPNGGTRFLIESETGSGKTEAVLILYAILRAAGLVSGLVFALPTRATAKGLFQRIRAAAKQMYGEGEMPTIALAVGGAAPELGSSKPTLNALGKTVGDDGDKAGVSAKELVRWASQSSKKFLAAEIVVGTIDQVLLAGLPVKHAHLRLAALSRHLLVVDEIHSYDRYMGTVLANLLNAHTAWGGLAVFMSATLSDAERARYGGAGQTEGTRSESEQRPYPLLSVLQPGGTTWEEVPLATPGAPQKAITWRTGEEGRALRRAIELACEGARVGIIRNTVAAARKTVESIRAMGGAALLWRPSKEAEGTPAYHSRYGAPDRKALDEAVLRSFGKGSAEQGVILVATQVAEQSLDVDFDWLVTDLCPIDVLLQRLGRLHRHPERGRPDLSSRAEAWVIVPENGWRSFWASGRGPNGWGTVYLDLADLELTWRAVRESPTVSIPRDNRRLIEQVYHSESRAELAADSEWATYIEQVKREHDGVEVQGLQARLDFDATYAEAAGQFNLSDEEAVRTRLGEDQVEISLGKGFIGHYSTAPIRSVTVPVRVLRKAGVKPEAMGPAVRVEGAPVPTWQIDGWVLRYTEQGWVW
jgi:CRISPR-associated endonuclease/helicase Cas3